MVSFLSAALIIPINDRRIFRVDSILRLSIVSLSLFLFINKQDRNIDMTLILLYIMLF